MKLTAEHAENAEAKKIPNSKHRISTITHIQKSNVDELVKSPKVGFSVIPAKAGI